MEIERAIEVIPELSDRFTHLQSVTANKENGPWFRCRLTMQFNRVFETDYSWELPDWAS